MNTPQECHEIDPHRSAVNNPEECVLLAGMECVKEEETSLERASACELACACECASVREGVCAGVCVCVGVGACSAIRTSPLSLTICLALVMIVDMSNAYTCFAPALAANMLKIPVPQPTS